METRARVIPVTRHSGVSTLQQHRPVMMEMLVQKGTLAVEGSVSVEGSLTAMTVNLVLQTVVIRQPVVNTLPIRRLVMTGIHVPRTTCASMAHARGKADSTVTTVTSARLIPVCWALVVRSPRTLSPVMMEIAAP